MDNLYQQFKAVFPDAPLFVGTVQSVSGGVATVELPDGGILRARGSAAIGAQVWVRDGVLEGDAPALPVAVVWV